jgi:hypothetical protein
MTSTPSVPNPPRLNVARGLLQGGAFLATGLVVSQNMPGSMSAWGGQYPILGDESIMAKKAHGTSEFGVQKGLRYGVDEALADRITCYNRNWAEMAGYWQSTKLLPLLRSIDPKSTEPISFYDSVTGVELFRAPKGRTMQEFIDESLSHGWPSYRDEEVVWDNVRCLKDGECVSLTGTHLGHNLPDRSGNRYCINLVSVAGSPSPSV